MIVVIDTNILVSGFLKPYSDASSIIKLIFERKIKLAYDIRILLEYEDVLKREEFDFNKSAIKIIIDFIKSSGINSSAITLKKTLPHENDNPFLEVAVASNADFLITGNKKHFPDEICKPIKVISIKEFMDIFKNSS